MVNSFNSKERHIIYFDLLSVRNDVKRDATLSFCTVYHHLDGLRTGLMVFHSGRLKRCRTIRWRGAQWQCSEKLKTFEKMLSEIIALLR